MDIAISIVVTVLLTIVNGFFSMSEMALSTAKKILLDHEAEEGDARAKQAADAVDNPDQFLAAIQVAITLVGFFSSAFAATNLSEPLGSLPTNQTVNESGNAVERTTITQIQYSPSMVILPYLNRDNEVVSEVVAQLKSEMREEERDKELDRVSVTKRWVVPNGSNAASNVKSIKVQLLQDGKLYGNPVELSEANNWKYEWANLEIGHEWSAQELSSEGSTVVWSKSVVTNTNNEIILTNTAVVPPEENPPTTPNTYTPGKLPKTGESWSPVPVLLVGACAFLGISRAIKLRGLKRD